MTALTTLRRAPLPAAAAGAGGAYLAVLVGTGACDCAAGTLGGVAAALLAAALLAAAVLCAPGRRRVAAGWAAGALIVALVPACLAAAAALALRRSSDAGAALAALPPGGLALEDASLEAPAVMLRGVTVRLDLMGEGIALWPMCVCSFGLSLRLLCAPEPDSLARRRAA